MTYIGCMNQLWRSAMMSPMPASEIALFAYLVNESNKRFWKMPFVCSTTRICDDLRLSRQTVITARKHLAERKLISFIEGNRVMYRQFIQYLNVRMVRQLDT